MFIMKTLLVLLVLWLTHVSSLDNKSKDTVESKYENILKMMKTLKVVHIDEYKRMTIETLMEISGTQSKQLLEAIKYKKKMDKTKRSCKNIRKIESEKEKLIESNLLKFVMRI